MDQKTTLGVTPFLMFKQEAKEAAEFYVSIIPNSKILDIKEFKSDSSECNSSQNNVFSVIFNLGGLEFIALNGSPYEFSGAISFMIHCENQEEVDNIWEKLSEGGEKLACGWIKDKFGVFWQIIPRIMGEMLSNSDTEKSARVMNAMQTMNKIEISELQKAFDGK